MGPYLHISEVVQEDDINEGAARILKKIRPDWDLDLVEFKLLTDGITNKLVSCFQKGGQPKDTVLVRVYGNKTDMLIDRRAEKRNILKLGQEGLAPKLYASFENGLAYEFVPGSTLSKETVVLPEIYRLVATRMAQMHKVEPFNTEPMLWNKIIQFLDLVPEKFSNGDKQNSFEQLAITKSKIGEELRALKSTLDALGSPIVFAHNDLLLGNVVYTEECKTVTFIDFEYAAANYQAYDIGNHFAEFVGLKDVDYSNYPDKSLQWNWLRIYLQEYRRKNSSDEPLITEKDIHNLYVQVNQFALASHVFWGIWALIQAEHSYIDFDYMGYAGVRFKEYFSRKAEFLSLQLISR